MIVDLLEKLKDFDTEIEARQSSLDSPKRKLLRNESENYKLITEEKTAQSELNLASVQDPIERTI